MIAAFLFGFGLGVAACIIPAVLLLAWCLWTAPVREDW